MQLLVGDYDGDGKSDYLFLDDNNNYVRLNLSYAELSVAIYLDEPDKIRLIDFDGDGKRDIMITKGSKTTRKSYNYASRSFLSLYYN